MSNLLTQQIPSVAGMIGAMAARSVITKAYKSRRGTEPPVDPGAEAAGWRSAIVWTAVLAAGAGVGRLVGRYVVAEQINKHVSDGPRLQKAD